MSKASTPDENDDGDDVVQQATFSMQSAVSPIIAKGLNLYSICVLYLRWYIAR
jgi:hypothetical protein